MKQIEELYIVFPKKKPKTIWGLYKWHRKLLEDCIFFEFKKRSIEAAIQNINSEIIKYVPIAKQSVFQNPAKLALDKLNRLKKEMEDELLVLKNVVMIIHDTNEIIIGNLAKSHAGPKGEELIRHFQSKTQPGSNLLHGQGWLAELVSAKELENQGYAPFVTFGTMFDPGGFDIIAFPRPRRRIKFNTEFPGKLPKNYA